MLRIGLVGSGFMAQTHLDRYREMANATVAAVASRADAAAFVAENDLDAATFVDAATMMDTDIDAVDICTPTPTHRRFVEAAATRGLDAFCEKPLALTLEDATAVAEAVSKTGITLMIGHVLRFFPGYREIHAAVADGQVGAPGTVRARRVSPFPDWADWYTDTDRSGGVFHDLAVHEFDFCRWAIGDVRRVFARQHRSAANHRCHASLVFENGAVGSVDAGWDRPPSGDLASEFEVAGDEGVLEYDAEEGAPLAIETTGDDPTLPSAVARDGYRRELDAFVRASVEGESSPIPVEDAVEAVRLSVAARRSAERGEPVEVAEVVA
jgi:predicted dehydrogenase